MVRSGQTAFNSDEGFMSYIEVCNDCGECGTLDRDIGVDVHVCSLCKRMVADLDEIRKFEVKSSQAVDILSK